MNILVKNNLKIMDKKKKIKVKLPENVEAGVYANAVSVNVNKNEFILDFAYNIPNTSEPVIKIVSRINMTHRTAESFLKLLSNAVLDLKNKQKDQE